MTMTPEERKQRNRESRLRLYARRRAAHECVDCGVPVPDGNVRCVPHRTRDYESKWVTRHESPERVSKVNRRHMKRRYRLRKRKGLCVRCVSKRDRTGALCSACLAEHKETHVRYLDRKEQGLTVPRTMPRAWEPDRMAAIMDPVGDYRSGFCTLREAVARFVALHNGVASLDITEAFAPDEKERATISQTLSRGAKDGLFLVEQTGSKVERLYYPVRAPVKRAA